MGNYRIVNPNVDNTKLPRMYPEPDYEIKTRPPVQTGHTWERNIKLKIKEENLADEAMPLARRKCYDGVMEFADCRLRQGFFWYVFNCQEEFHELGECLQHEFKVQMDKKRRDMQRNPQSWWQACYDQDGEVGVQAATPEYDPSLWQSIKFTFLGK